METKTLGKAMSDLGIPESKAILCLNSIIEKGYIDNSSFNKLDPEQIICSISKRNIHILETEILVIKECPL